MWSIFCLVAEFLHRCHDIFTKIKCVCLAIILYFHVQHIPCHSAGHWYFQLNYFPTKPSLHLSVFSQTGYSHPHKNYVVNPY